MYNYVNITKLVNIMPGIVCKGMLELKWLDQFEVIVDGRRLSGPTRNAQSPFSLWRVGNEPAAGDRAGE
jgi:hypothetical protein